MDRLSRLFACLLLLVLPLAAALKFDLHPGTAHDAAANERCVRNFVAKEQLVVVTAILDGFKGDGQKVDMHVCFFAAFPEKAVIYLAHSFNWGDKKKHSC